MRRIFYGWVITASRRSPTLWPGPSAPPSPCSTWPCCTSSAGGAPRRRSATPSAGSPPGLLASRRASQRPFGPRVLVPVGGLLLAARLALTGRTQALWHYYLAFGVLVAAGIACIMMPAAAVIGHWFIRSRGAAMGIISAGSSLSRERVKESGHERLQLSMLRRAPPGVSGISAVAPRRWRCSVHRQLASTHFHRSAVYRWRGSAQDRAPGPWAE
jgi:hypothetical protein